MRSTVVALLLLVTCVCSVVTADAPTAILIGDSVLVPMRPVFEWLNATVTYAGGKITAVRGTDTVSLTVGRRQASVNGRSVVLPTPPVLRGGTTHVPLRFVAESMGAGVNYDASARRVVVSESGRSLTIPIASDDPVATACAAFRSFMQQVHSEQYAGKRIGLIDRRRHTWIFRDYPYAYPGFEGPKGTTGLERDSRFRGVLIQGGGVPGGPWFPYDIAQRSSSEIVVAFLEWNWDTKVHVASSATGWRPTMVEAWGEGMEGAPPDRWSVSGGGTEYVFAKIR